MTTSIHLALVLHNHQPVGNFDGVIEQAYHDSYQPFLDVFEGYPNLRIALHTSGPLLEWLDARYPEYIERVAALVGEGRIEIVGGAFYEPILTMIPSRDRIGQIRAYTEWLTERLSAQVQGIWIAERVWEQSMVRDLVDAGVRYTVVDDFHFKSAGLGEHELRPDFRVITKAA
ncbi:MAG: alpha-amylase, partial [Pirellulales bacterium]